MGCYIFDGKPKLPSVFCLVGGRLVISLIRAAHLVEPERARICMRVLKPAAVHDRRFLTLVSSSDDLEREGEGINPA